MYVVHRYAYCKSNEIIICLCLIKLIMSWACIFCQCPSIANSSFGFLHYINGHGFLPLIYQIVLGVLAISFCLHNTREHIHWTAFYTLQKYFSCTTERIRPLLYCATCLFVIGFSMRTFFVLFVTFFVRIVFFFSWFPAFNNKNNNNKASFRTFEHSSLSKIVTTNKTASKCSWRRILQHFN